jgi:hypothetical protein
MDTTRWLMERSARFPKHLRHSLTHRIETLALGILEELTSAAYTRQRQAHLEAAHDQMNRLRVMVRLCHEMQVLATNHYEEAAQRMSEAGKMLGAMMKRGDREPEVGAAL